MIKLAYIWPKNVSNSNIAPIRNAKPGQKSIVALNILLKISADKIGHIVSTMLNAVNRRAV